MTKPQNASPVAKSKGDNGSERSNLDDLAIWRGVDNNIKIVMPKIDAELEARDEALSTRPFSATTAYILQNVRGFGDMVEFCTTEPYARIRVLINNWYKENYGALMDADPSAPSCIVVRGGVFSFTVPLTVYEPAEEPNTIWAAFPGVVFDEEDPLLWIDAAAPLSQLRSDERCKLETLARERATLVRSIRHRLTMGLSNMGPVSALAETALGDLGNAATLLLRQSATERAGAGWSLCQAVEKTLKSYLFLNDVTPPRTHKLQNLADIVDKIGEFRVQRALLGKIPSGANAVDLRYGKSLALGAALDAYDAALRLMDVPARAMHATTKTDMTKARFKITAPWAHHNVSAFLKEMCGSAD